MDIRKSGLRKPIPKDKRFFDMSALNKTTDFG
jgi:hypothetical protein